jgi:hypothetical protein
MREHVMRVLGAGADGVSVVVRVTGVGAAIDSVLCRWRMRQAMEYRMFAARLHDLAGDTYSTAHTVDMYNGWAERIEGRCAPGGRGR